MVSFVIVKANITFTCHAYCIISNMFYIKNLRYYLLINPTLMQWVFLLKWLANVRLLKFWLQQLQKVEMLPLRVKIYKMESFSSTMA